MRKLSLAILMVAAVVVVLGWILIPDVDPRAEIVRPEVNLVTQRTTEFGDVIGFLDQYGTRAWLGIPYAAPPVAELRWKAPRVPVPNAEIYEALEFGHACPQFNSMIGPAADGDPEAVTGAEDCLTLNIWSAPNNAAAPVMVWIHGGGNTVGYSGSYSGARLASEHRLVVVTINYRLGPLGWFYHSKLNTGDEADRSGNYGTLDLIQALKWIRGNIRSFGGDPDNITVFGESAGGVNALSLVASPLAKGLFHRTIVQSGSYETTTLRAASEYVDNGGTVNSSSEIIANLLVADRLAADFDEAKGLLASYSANQIQDYLGAKSPAMLYRVLDGGAFGMFPLPTLLADGHVLPEGSDVELFGEFGSHHPVPIMLGTNRDEPALFMVSDPRFVKTSFWFFRSIRDVDDYKKHVYYGAQAWKATGVDRIAQAMVAAGNPDVFAYRFDWDEEPEILGFDLATALGAAHGLEISFVFGSFETGMSSAFSYIYPNDANQFALSNSMMSYWAEFAYSGNPATGRDGDLPPWLPWGIDDSTTMILDTPTDGGLRMISDVVTSDALLEELLNDEEIVDLKTRCAIYVRFLSNLESFDDTVYKALGCADIEPSTLAFY